MNCQNTYREKKYLITIAYEGLEYKQEINTENKNIGIYVGNT